MNRSGFRIYIFLLILAVGVIGWRFQDGLPLDTNLIAMMPKSENAEWVTRAEAVERTQGMDQLIVLVGHADFESARAAADMLGKGLVDAGILKAIFNDASFSTFRSFAETLFPHRTGLISKADRHLLQAGQAGKLIDRAMVQIVSPLSVVDAETIRRDPYLLLPNYLAAGMENSTKMQSRANVLTVEEKGVWYVLLRGQLSGNPFDKTFQTRALKQFTDAVARAETRYGALKLLKTGAIFYGEHAYRQAEGEAGFIGVISLIGIVILNFLIFRSLQPLVLSLVAIASGILNGLAMTLLIFGSLQMMALVFGMGLIGIAVDYAFHYFCEKFDQDSRVPTARLRARAIRSGLTLGLVSSVLGFTTLALTPFPGLQQIAVFSASGLVMAYLCVLYVFPHLDRTPSFRHGENLLSAAMFPYNFWWRKSFRNWRIAFLGILIVAGLFGATRVTVDDDVHRLQSLPADLKAEEEAIRDLAGINNQTYRFFVRGINSENTLRAEEALAPKLEALKKDGAIGGYRMISQSIPSKARQLENRALVESELMPRLERHMAALGLAGETPYRQPGDPLELDKLAESDMPGLLSQLRVYKTPGTIVHAVMLIDVKDVAALTKLAGSSENIALISHADSLSKTFGAYRVRALIMLAIAYCVVLVFLSLRYGVPGALKVMLPSMSAVALAPCLIALMGEPFTFFNAMSLVLIFAIGLDYALFMRESSVARQRRSMLANFLAALSTLLAFGLLALSETFAIHAFGVTILVGITLAYLLAPIAADAKHPMTEPL